MTSRLLVSGLVALLVPWACRKPADPAPPSATTINLAGLERFTVATGTFSGLSDLTIDGQGRMWSVPERGRALLPVLLTGSKPGLQGDALPVVDLPPEVDMEALTWVSDQRFAVGTETHAPRSASSAVLWITLEGAGAVVGGKVDLPYSLWDFQADKNRGIEGLCAARERLVAAVETVLERDGKRFAPIGRYDLTTGAWTPLRLALTSRDGKLSALACRAAAGADGSLEVLAIERHYRTSRLLRFTLPASGPPQDLTPTIVADLGATIPDVPNLEGIAWGPDGRLYLLSDNDSGGVAGTTHAFILPAP